jgi:hypothetical protein
MANFRPPRRARLALLVPLAAALVAPAALRAQGVQLFRDGFESGTPWHWSALPGGIDPRAICSSPFAPVDMTGATTVGTGTPGSCTQAALDAALASNNGRIRFDCGAAPHTIVVTSEKVIDDDLVIDGGGRITLSGGGTTRILGIRPPWGTTPLPTVTLQSLTFYSGSTAHLPGNTVANGGGAIFKDSFANLRILNSVFVGNRGPATGQDVAGGAIYAFGEGTTTIVRSRFSGNRCSSGGALGALGTSNHSLLVFNTLFDRNLASGTGGNPGNGGNGGAIYMDGASQTVGLCGVMISDNDANARGGGLFRVSNDGVGPMTVDRTSVLWNLSPASADSQAGGMYLQGLQLTIVDSTIANNAASSAGGLFVWTNPGSQSLTMINSTVAGNQARTSLGAGLSMASGMTGTLRNVTIARNHNSGEFSFASAVAGGQNVAVSNSLIADNTKVFVWEDVSCNSTHPGSSTYQWPAQNAGGEAERPCAATTTFLAPQLGALGWMGGPTPVITPANPALAGAASSNCPATDQNGAPRGATCTPGAVEMP